MQIKVSKKLSVKDMAKLIKEKLQISDVETVPATENAPAGENIKDEL
jgi:protein disulfide-isomerase A1